MESNRPSDNKQELSHDLFEDMQKNVDKRYKRDFVLVILLLTFVVSVPVILFLTFKNANFDPNKLFMFKNKIEFNLRDFANNQIKAKAVGESVSIRITDKELGETLKINTPDFPLKKAVIKVSPDKIILSGRSGKSILSLKVDVTLMPKIEYDKITLEIASIDSLGVVAPKQIVDLVKPALASKLSSVYEIPANLQITEVKQNDGNLLLIGKVK